jgi:phage shock protein PspC (stress-responsive transcriptional regulator)
MSNLPAKRRRRGELARTKGLYRDLDGGKLGGVCAGLARWTGVPSIFWRLGFVAAFFGWGAGLGVYLLMWVLMDKPPEEEKPQRGPADLDEDEREIWNAVKKDMASLDLEND